MKLIILLMALATSSWSHKNPHYHDNHSTIVHLFEWKWNDIAQECENFLGPNGYGGIQVSPPNENLVINSAGRPWWERYQPLSYVLTTRSGNEQEFASMVRRCNTAGVRIYVDAIINHMTGTWTENVGTAGNQAIFNEWSYPAVPYGSNDFNWPICHVHNYDNPFEVRNCELLGLKDLNQGTEYVRQKLTEFMNKLISMGVAGFRIDAAKHMWPADLRVIYDRLDNLNTDHGFVQNARPYIYQEIIDFGGDVISHTEYRPMSPVTEFKYGVELSNAFRGNNPLVWLSNFGEGWGMIPSADAFVFIDNHDNQRGHTSGDPLTYKEPKAYKAAIAFMLAYPYGETQIMSSFDFTNTEIGPPMDGQQNIISPSFNPDGSCGNGWVCEHRWRQIYQMIGFRNEIQGTPLTNWWSNGNNQIAFCRGGAGFIAFNIENHDLNENLQTCLPAGNYCDVISGVKNGNQCSGRTITVSQSGIANISIRGSDEDYHVAIHTGQQSRL